MTAVELEQDRIVLDEPGKNHQAKGNFAIMPRGSIADKEPPRYFDAWDAAESAGKELSAKYGVRLEYLC